MPLRGWPQRGASSFHLLQEVGEIGPRELPVEGRGDMLVMVLKAAEPIRDILQRREVIGRERLTLDDGEVDLDLVEPAGVDWAMDEHEIGEGGLEPADGGIEALNGPKPVKVTIEVAPAP